MRRRYRPTPRTALLAALACVCLSLPQCLVLNSLDLAPGHIKGDEAKELIRSRLSELLLLGVISDSLPLQLAGLASAEVVGIDESAYYKELDVKECAEQILNASVALFRSGTASLATVGVVSVAACDLQPDSAIFDP